MLGSLSEGKILMLKITSYITSLIPLSIYILIKYLGDHTCMIENLPNIECGCKFIWLTPHNIAIFQACIQLSALILFLIIINKIVRKGEETNYINIRLENVVKEKTNTTSYLLSNVLPIVSFDISSVDMLVFVVFLLGLLGIMYIKNNLYFINPLYDLLGISVYSADTVKLDEHNREIDTYKLEIISLINLYQFDDQQYIGYKASDILIIKREK